MSLEPSLLFAGFIFGVLGYYLFKEGKKSANFGKLGLGVALMVYPYFVTNLWLTWIIGIVLFAVGFRLP